MANGTIGQIVFVGTDGYQEIVEAEANGARLVECTSLESQFPMYRLEYQDAGGYNQNETYFDWYSASANFERRSTEE